MVLKVISKKSVVAFWYDYALPSKCKHLYESDAVFFLNERYYDFRKVITRFGLGWIVISQLQEQYWEQ